MDGCGGLVESLSAAHLLLDRIFDSGAAGESDADLVEACRLVERLRYRLAAVDHLVIGQVDSRGIPQESGASSTAAFLRGLLRIDAGQAAGRVRAAAALGARHGLTGESLPPIFQHVAAAQAAGEVSERHAQLIVRTVDGLPDIVQAENGDKIEAELTDYARQFEPRSLAQLATRLVYCYDPDGVLADAEHRERTRDVTLHTRPDGSATVTGELTAECAERLLTHFDALAGPVPATDGVPDSRTAGQRRHDALLAMLDLQQRAGLLSNTGGVSTTVVLTMTDEAFRAGHGLAATGHGALLPARHAAHWGGRDVRVLACTVNDRGQVDGHGHTRRLFTENQRLALAARDGGCTFPGCDAPPAWCQIHHIREYRHGGRTRLDNAAMICGYHHRTFDQHGWRPELIDNRVAWHPPRWLDPDGVPRYNHLHDLVQRT